MNSDEKRIRHLEAILGVIERLARNSFAIKGWTITLVSALTALAAYKANFQFVIVCFLPIVMLWLLDGFFLWQERLFRALYNHVRSMTEERPQDFFSMDTGAVKSTIPSIWCAWFSGTLLLFYGGILFAVILVWNLVTMEGKHG